MGKTIFQKKILSVEDTSESDSLSDSDVSFHQPTIDTSIPHISREEIEKIAGMKVGENLTNYRRAFVHKSIENIARNSPNSMEYTLKSNETLEFVGDSILGAIVADKLYREYPNENEGFLTTSRIKMVKSSALSHFAECLGMADKILMANQAIRTGGKNNRRFLEDAFESFVGAVFYDKGFYGAQQFVLGVIDKYFDGALINKNDNYKDILLRYSQSIKIALPEYIVIKEIGPPHNREFLVEVKLFDKRQGKGKAKTIKMAEQRAAHQAMKRLGIDENF